MNAHVGNNRALDAYWMPFTANRQFKQAPRMLVGAALSALPMGLVLLVVNAAFRGSPLSLTEYVAGVLTALPIALVMCLLSWLALDGSRQEDAPSRRPIRCESWSLFRQHVIMIQITRNVGTPCSA